MHVIFPFFNESKKWTNHNASFPCGMLQFLGRLKSTKLYRFSGSLICVLYMLPRNLFDLPGNVGNVRRKCYGHGQISVRQARKKEKRFKNHQATSVTSWLARVWQAVRKGLGDRSYKHLWHEPPQRLCYTSGWLAVTRDQTTMQKAQAALSDCYDSGAE